MRPSAPSRPGPLRPGTCSADLRPQGASLGAAMKRSASRQCDLQARMQASPAACGQRATSSATCARATSGHGAVLQHAEVLA